MDRCRAAVFGSSSLHRIDKLPGGRGGDDSELDVFAAERYFNGDDDALWCGHSSSSLSSAFRTGTHEHDRSVPTPTAATTSSEASWNSRSALLPDGKALAVAPDVEEKKPSGTAIEHTAGRKAPPSYHLGRWLLGLAGCACTGGDGEESSASADDDKFFDEVEEADNVAGVGCKKHTTEAAEPFRRTENKDRASEEAATVSVRPGRWLDDGDALLAGTAAFSPVKLPGDGHRQAASSGEFFSPILYPATTATSDEQRRKSLQMFRRPVGDQGSAILSGTQNSASTIVAGKTAWGGALHAAVASGGSPGASRMPCDGSQRSSREDEAALNELECAYPPSEASVVWSVVTAEGAASCNISSAASGYYYYYFNDGEDGVSRHAAGESNRRRRSEITNCGGGLLTCMREKAVDAVGPAGSVPRSIPPVGGRAGRRRGDAESCRWRPER